MRSSTNALRKRGYVTDKDITEFSTFSQEQLIDMLHSEEAVIRSASACNLIASQELSTKELLKQLVIEKCLYTKIAICESLERGDCNTAILMAEYLGKIGNNQHQALPDRVSDKKSYPLPRDIIARSLGKMRVEVLLILQSVINGNDIGKIREALDAIGYMVFYHQSLATDENLLHILSLLHKYYDYELILWKIMLCLSAFPLTDSIHVLTKYSYRQDLIGLEAQRSLSLLK